MTRTLLLTLAIGLAAASVEAACYADYKAKKDGPLRLHYGVIELSEAACGNPGQARAEVQSRIGGGGWTLLNVMSTFGPEGLNERRASAGEFFLRF